ncbi:HD domain-containing protein [Burkholderia multivorans]|uniref:HD domain-containing protein n=1 Tax=Burkholderia multivorans TaxID=87883 RepID=A0AAP2HN42_9BURK|nr:phosphonate degradation HD-domain oxygenase [Burkholderia multivorans]MBU9359454.1 HD domain-containing protein [Burkholderia multivorans]MBU9366660.1 HD domain-containing protein [Burkholderia multivorans]MBU9596209.1 HD domain-containing protein [Burkholderia multivorans]MCA8486426.1 HD domain-containing protein [Burkholderia multivorans]MCO1374255.1 HD domain-containing protein [Burkholderia multivorans]
MALTVEDIDRLYREHGHVAYSGEPVTQLEHALQSGLLAEEAGADEALVAAAFLHDLGHLLNRQGETPSARGIDDLHQYFVLPFLRPLFSDAVLEPIRLHVDAKRCLCRTDAGYLESLSPDSVRSLALQGGVFSEEEAATFMRRPYAEDALRLRRWDDTAKTEGKPTPDLDHYMEIVARQVRAA